MKPFLVSVMGGGLVMWGAPSRAAEPVDYVGKVLPIMKKHCWDCHSRETEVKGNLALDVAVLTDQIGPYNIIRPGDPEKSGFVERLKLDEGHNDFMPRRGKRLLPREIAAIEEWIRQGAIVDASKPSPEEAKRLAAAGMERDAPPEEKPWLSWTNREGRRIEARFLGLVGEAVQLQTRDGKRYAVPLGNLDEPSQAQARAAAAP
jgi:mono/diheme cytochrome c family protein